MVNTSESNYSKRAKLFDHQNNNNVSDLNNLSNQYGFQQSQKDVNPQNEHLKGIEWPMNTPKNQQD
jgi:hypothetical protein